MGGFFAVASKTNCMFDLYFGTDYHSHLGTRRAGMTVYDRNLGFNRAIHNIENSPFRTKFDKEVGRMEGQLGIGCISDFEPQPLIVRSHHGTYAISTVGKINNTDQLVEQVFKGSRTHFLEMSGGTINATELTAAIINQKDNLVEGIQYAQELIDGSMTILLMTPDGIYCARDRYGRTPVILGQKEDGCCASFESFAYLNLGYRDLKELGPGEIVVLTPEGVTTLADPGKDIDVVAGVPDSGTAHAVGYANESGVPFSRPFIKYTPTWPRSFMPTIQEKRNLIAKMKLIPVRELIQDRSLLLIDDSIVRGTQLRETTEYLFDSGAREVHVRPACPPILFGCKYINFSRSTSEMELIARRIINEEEGGAVERTILEDYANPDSDRYHKMLDKICERLKFTSLRYQRLDDMIASIGIDPDCLCTYCWNGRE